jgi:transposase
MFNRLPCCNSPNRQVPQAVIRAQAKRNAKYVLPYTTLGERMQMSALVNVGHSYAETAALLGCSKATVQRQMNKLKVSNTYLDKEKTGRPRKITEEVGNQILSWIEEDRRNTSSKLSSLVKEKFSVDVGERAIRIFLTNKGYFGGVCARKPLLRDQNKANRLAFALKHVDKSPEFWKSVLFTDEKKFEIFNSKRRIYCWKQKGEELRNDTIQPTVKHGGGSIMMWGCFLGDRVGDLFKVNGIMKKEEYHSILQRHAVPSGLRLYGQGFVLQQDNDPKHTSKLCKNYLESKQEAGTLTILDWPSQSPDLNPIELLWEKMDREIKKKKPTSLPELERICREVWSEITPEYLNKLVERMPRLCKAVIQAEGGYFDEKYAPKKFKNQQVYP